MPITEEAATVATPRTRARKSQISPTPSARQSAGRPRGLGIVGDGQRGGGGKADGDLPADGQRLVVPGVADVGLEDLARAGLDVVAKRVAEIGNEAHPAEHNIAAGDHIAAHAWGPRADR